MIPENTLNKVEIATIPSRDYRMDMESNHVAGKVDGLEAMRQVVYHILNTERYQYPIYSWNYGVELADLFGKPVDFVLSEVPRRISEALTQDDRITSVDEFTVDAQGGTIQANFVVHTIYGPIEGDKRWNYV